MKWIKYSYRQKISLLFLTTMVFGISIYRYIDHLRFINNGGGDSPVEMAWFAEDLFGKKDKNYKPAAINKQNRMIGSNGSSSSERQLFYFDPNSLPSDSLIMLGLSKYAVRNLVKYRENGGVFIKKESLLKVYGIDSSLYFQLEEFIDIEMKNNPVRKKFEYPDYKTYPKAKESINLDVNLASEEEFKELKGIGEKLSKRLVKYRESLGGFSSIGQIKEIYGLSEETYDAILPQLLLEEHQLRKMPINTVSFKELLKHPYADYELTKQLINYRNSHGIFTSEDDFNSIYLVDGEKLRSLLPYLSFEIKEEATSPDSSAIDLEKRKK